MPEVRKLLLIGAATLLLGLVVMFPARVAYHWFVPDEVRLSDIDGTIWNGRAATADISGLYLSDLRWSFRPLSLFRARLAYTLTADPAGGFLEADAAASFLGTVYIDTLNAALPLAALQGAVRIDDVAGDLSLQLSDIRIENGLPRQAVGRIAIANLVVRALATAPLGDFEADIQTTDGDIIGSVSDVRGMLKVAGTVTLDENGGYALVGLVGPTASAAQSVVQQLRFLGTPDARGLREFRIEGAL